MGYCHSCAFALAGQLTEKLEPVWRLADIFLS